MDATRDLQPRWDFERAVLASKLPAPARQILLTLAVLADWPAGTTPLKHTPSLTRLANTTGLGRSTVAEHLNTVESRGWIRRLRPPVAKARAAKDRTRYGLITPTSPGAGLVQEPDQPETGTSPGAGPELVQELDHASPGAGHVPDLLQTNQTKDLYGAPAARRGTRVPENFAVTAAMRTWHREKTPNVDLETETAQFLDHWRAAIGTKATKADWTAAWRTWMRNAAKWKTERASSGNGRPPANRHHDNRPAGLTPFSNAVAASQATTRHTP